MSDSSDDKSLGEVLQMSVRCVCLLITMTLLVTIVGYIFVAIQAIWAKNLGSEVDQLEYTNELLEKNNERFKANNDNLEKEVNRLNEDVEQLREEIGNFSNLNFELQADIADLNQNNQKLENTTDDLKNQSQQLKTNINNISNETDSLQDNIQRLNSTAERLKDELEMFRDLEIRMKSLQKSTENSFNNILYLARELYINNTKDSARSLQTMFMSMLNRVELSEDGKWGFTRTEYTEWITRVSYILAQNPQILLQQYPYGKNTKTYGNLTVIIDQIVLNYKQSLLRVSDGEVLGWFIELQDEHAEDSLDVIELLN